MRRLTNNENGVIMKALTRRLAAVLIALVSVTTAVVAAPERSGAYEDTWCTGNAYFYAWDGLWERYVYGGGMWDPNDYWDDYEGVDCSGYVNKVFALEDWTWPTDYYHPYSTYSWYMGLVGHSWYVDPWTVVDPWAWMTTWVYRDDFNGNAPGKHMGVFQADNGDGSWVVFEARGSSYGVVINNRWISDLLYWGYSRWSRENWDG